MLFIGDDVVFHLLQLIGPRLETLLTVSQDHSVWCIDSDALEHSECQQNIAGFAASSLSKRLRFACKAKGLSRASEGIVHC